MPKNIVASVAADALIAENPDLPSKQLARIALSRWPDIFANPDAAYQMFRYRRKSKGKTMREHREHAEQTSGLPVYEKKSDLSPWQGLPPALSEFEWRVIEIEEKLTLVLADIHFPYYDPIALNAALHDAESRNPDCILILGDMLDFYSISEFRKDPRREDLLDTLRTGYVFLRLLRRRFPKARIIWKYGNHEERWEHFLWRKAPELCRQVPRLSDLEYLYQHASLFDETLPDANLDIEYVKHPVPLRVGMLYLLHGHEYARGTSSPVNAARTAQLKTNECCMVAHQHQRSEQSLRTVGDRVISTWSVGCLCNLHPRYNPLSPTWSHSFAYIDKGRGRNFLVTSKRIIQGEVY